MKGGKSGKAHTSANEEVFISNRWTRDEVGISEGVKREAGAKEVEPNVQVICKEIGQS